MRERENEIREGRDREERSIIITCWPSNLFATALRARMSFPSKRGLRADSTMKSAAAFRALVSIYACIYPSIDPSFYTCVYIYIYQSIHLSIHPYIHPSIHPSFDSFIYSSILSTIMSCLSIVCMCKQYLSVR